MIPKKVIIVGAGRTAWMAAAYLQSALGRAVAAPPGIVVIDPPGMPQPGPGLAAAPTLKHLLDVVGIDEISLLRRVGGTFRQATRYENWLRGTGDFFYHPFDDARAQPIDRAALQWLMSDRSIAFAETVSPQPVICDLGLAPNTVDGGPSDLSLKYAYHVNETELAGLLRENATSGGVEHWREKFAGLELAENGEVAAINTEGGGRLEADLFIDCSGSDALLSSPQSRVDWVDCARWLPCDREIRMDIEYQQYYPGRVRPFTTVTALSSGWVTDTPLQDRRALGYVHSARHIDEADASRELRSFAGRHASSLSTCTVQFESGHRARPWARNCVSLGSSGAVIEPLASANQYLDDLGIIALAEHFPMGDDFGPFEFRFNRIMTNRYYELLDFVNLHYALTRRSDSEFWRDAAKPERMNDRLKAKLEFWKRKVPSRSDFVDQHLPGQPDSSFGAVPGDQPGPVDTGATHGLESYEAILYGMQFLADECDAWFGAHRPPTRVPGYIVEDLKRAPAMLPPHDAWLRQFAGMAAYPVTGTAQT